jgi:hypothetical protein
MTLGDRKKQLSDMVRKAHEISRKIYEDKKDLCPVVLAQNEDDKLLTIPFAFNGPDEKAMMARAVSQTLREANCVRYIFSSTAWMRNLPKPPDDVDQDKYLEKLVAAGEIDKLPKTEILITYGRDMWGNRLSIRTVIADQILGTDEEDDTLFEENIFTGVF